MSIDRNARRRAARALTLTIGGYSVARMERAYRECALWASNDSDPLDYPEDYDGTGPEPERHNLDDVDAAIDRDGRAAMALDCAAFLRQLADPEVTTAGAWPYASKEKAPVGVPLATLAMDAGVSEDQLGHDFWLTRNGHGAGFWDRGLGALGDALSSVAKWEGSCDLYLYRKGRRGMLRIGVQ